jgi:uncharacterized protein (TIGR02466 family)
MPNLNVAYWFPTPIWHYNFEAINNDQYDEAIKYCSELKQNSPGRKISNYGGWQSNDLPLDSIFSTPLAPFLTEIKPLFADLIASIDSSLTIDFDNVWVNINKKNDKNLSHNHPCVDFAGVFYLTENNSDIVFQRDFSTAVWWQECLSSKGNTVSTYKQATYKPKKGSVLIFPSWLHHYVKNNEQDSERISIAFNLHNTILKND